MRLFSPAMAKIDRGAASGSSARPAPKRSRIPLSHHVFGHFIEPRSNEISRIRKLLLGMAAQRFEASEYRQYASGLFGQESFQSAPGGDRAIYSDQRDFDRAVRVVLDRVLFDAEVDSHKTAR